MYAREFTRTVLRQAVTEALSEPEWLVVRLTRLWLWQPDCRPEVAATWDRALGPVAGFRATVALGGLLDALASGARRTLNLHRPLCRCVTADERAVLTVLGALQAGRVDHAEAVLRWLVSPADRPHARLFADRLAVAMADGGVAVRCPAVPRPLAPARPGPRPRIAVSRSPGAAAVRHRPPGGVGG